MRYTRIPAGKVTLDEIERMGRVVATASGQSKHSPVTFEAVMICLSVLEPLPYRTFIHWAGTDDFELCSVTSGAQMAYRSMDSDGATIEWNIV